ncbi:2367_t:CDS:2 [Acaulospora colombiana]|uniref:2367_t:CDS:1 n=1 Tax=Acaulospora colombiana TaxID=27376 RepID=A0ACA9LLZ4_9GLOM|nr:2367_t:CDS:2 [Acaulospora colombiana]
MNGKGRSSRMAVCGISRKMTSNIKRPVGIKDNRESTGFKPSLLFPTKSTTNTFRTRRRNINRKFDKRVQGKCIIVKVQDPSHMKLKSKQKEGKKRAVLDARILNDAIPILPSRSPKQQDGTMAGVRMRRENVQSSVSEKALKELGFLMNMKKCRLTPSRKQEFLGFLLDTESMEIKLPH